MSEIEEKGDCYIKSTFLFLFPLSPIILRVLNEKKAADILLGQKQLLSVQYSFERGQQVGKLHLLECIDSMQGIWMNATFWHKITETHSVTKPYSRKIAL